MEVRGQLAIVKSLLLPCGSLGQTRVLRVGGKHLCPLSHLACLHLESFHLALLAVP